MNKYAPTWHFDGEASFKCRTEGHETNRSYKHAVRVLVLVDHKFVAQVFVFFQLESLKIHEKKSNTKRQCNQFTVEGATLELPMVLYNRTVGKNQN